MINKVTVYRVKKATAYLKHYGWREFWIRLKERLQTRDVDYGTWYQKHEVSEEVFKEQQETKFAYNPLISIIVPVYNTPGLYLEQMIASVRRQSYKNWEICIANASPLNDEVRMILERYRKLDAGIRVVELTENQGIAQNTNAALAIASGEFVGFLDHDDLLAADALFEVVKLLNENRSLDMIYTDEDKVTEDLSKHFQPHFKPEFNLDLIRANNYICHFCVMRKELIQMVGGLQEAFNGAQDYDLFLRCIEKTEKIARIPRILYHWRVHSKSTADNPTSKMYAYEAGKRAIEAHLERCGEKAVVSCKKDLGFYRVKYDLQEDSLVSIIIPNRDHIEDLKICLHAVQSVAYKNYEVIIIENNSTEKETFDYYKSIISDQIKVVTWEQEFNYASMNNFGVKHAKGEYLLFLNNDTAALSADWMEEMLSNCQRKNVGVVGAKLYYPNETIQHAGVIIGIGGVAGHVFLGMSKDFSGYMHKASLQQNLSAVTAACMMVKRTVFEEAGGFTEQLAIAFNDVDFCLKVREKGHLIVFDPYVELMHYESKTRGAEDTEEKLQRFENECNYMKHRWKGILQKGDPMYNPNLTLRKWDYSVSEQKE